MRTCNVNGLKMNGSSLPSSTVSKTTHFMMTMMICNDFASKLSLAAQARLSIVCVYVMMHFAAHVMLVNVMVERNGDANDCSSAMIVWDVTCHFSFSNLFTFILNENKCICERQLADKVPWNKCVRARVCVCCCCWWCAFSLVKFDVHFTSSPLDIPTFLVDYLSLFSISQMHLPLQR